MIRKLILATTLSVVCGAANATVILSEDFDNVGTLTASGWTLVNNSTAGGQTSWFQGNSGVFDAQSGAPDSYIAANFLNAPLGGNISTWLISPVLNLSDALSLSFATRSTGFLNDSLEVRFSTAGASGNVGSTDSSLGDFTNLLLSVNPLLDYSYPTDWQTYSLSFAGVGSGTLGRFAFRYTVADTFSNADYIGIDSVQASVPEPSTLALFGGAFVLLVLFGRRRMPLALGASVVLAAGTASAEEAKSVAAQPTASASGLMTFANVKVVNAPAEAGKAAAKSDSGMRAYIDPTTRTLRAQTVEEGQQIAAEAKAKAQAQSAKRASARTAVAADAATDPSAATIYGPGNAVGMQLGDEFMIYQVVRKSDDGLVNDEVVGRRAAEKSLRAKNRSAAKSEVSHDR